MSSKFIEQMQQVSISEKTTPNRKTVGATLSNNRIPMQKLMSKQEMLTLSKRHSPSFIKQSNGTIFGRQNTSSEGKESVDKISVGDEN